MAGLLQAIRSIIDMMADDPIPPIPNTTPEPESMVDIYIRGDGLAAIIKREAGAVEMWGETLCDPFKIWQFRGYR